MYSIVLESILDLQEIKQRLEPVIKDKHEETLELLKAFDFCYELSEKEEKEVYGGKLGYLFPSLRPSNGKASLLKTQTSGDFSIL